MFSAANQVCVRQQHLESAFLKKNMKEISLTFVPRPDQMWVFFFSYLESSDLVYYKYFNDIMKTKVEDDIVLGLHQQIFVMGGTAGGASEGENQRLPSMSDRARCYHLQQTHCRMLMTSSVMLAESL